MARACICLVRARARAAYRGLRGPEWSTEHSISYTFVARIRGAVALAHELVGVNMVTTLLCEFVCVMGDREDWRRGQLLVDQLVPFLSLGTQPSSMMSSLFVSHASIDISHTAQPYEYR